MARKGDIDSKSVASRLPMDLYIQLLKSSSSNKQTISLYVANIINEALNGVPPQPIIKTIEVEVQDPKQQKRIEQLIDEIAVLQKKKKEVDERLEMIHDFMSNLANRLNGVKWTNSEWQPIIDSLKNHIETHYGE